MWHALKFFDQKEENKTPTLFSAPHKIPSNPPLKKGGESEIAPLQKDGVFESPSFESPPLLKGDLGRFFKSPLNSTVLPVEDSRNRKPAPYSKTLMLKHEEETLGFLCSIHPLDRYTDILEHIDYVRAMDLKSMVGKQVTTIGWQITGKTVHTKDGKTMKFISFEDQTGIYETVLFPKVYNRYCHMLNATRPYILKGKVEENFGAITMTVNWIGFLDKYQEKKPPKSKQRWERKFLSNK
jgi:DNA polymerase III alpha subunit